MDICRKINDRPRIGSGVYKEGREVSKDTLGHLCSKTSHGLPTLLQGYIRS